MASQDWLSGGYVGKLGATIGQVYHGTWYVRTYTKPHNPKTPTQQANRASWREAQTRASLAYATTGKATFFPYGKVGVYPRMCGLARTAMRDDGPASQVWPYLPRTGGALKVVALQSLLWHAETSSIVIAMRVSAAWDYPTVIDTTARVALKPDADWVLLTGTLSLVSGSDVVSVVCTYDRLPDPPCPYGVSMWAPFGAPAPYPATYIDPYDFTWLGGN